MKKGVAKFGMFLGAVKVAFGKFGIVLEKTKKKLTEAVDTIDQTGVKTRAIERQLKKVQELPSSESSKRIVKEIDSEENFEDLLRNNDTNE